MGLEKLNERHKKNQNGVSKMSTNDVLLKLFNEKENANYKNDI